MPRKKHNARVVVSATLLIVGEGIHDKAFLNYLKQVYDSRGNNQKVTVHSADGGSPQDILKTTMKKYKHTDFNNTVILIDSDVTITQQTRDLARRSHIEIIESTPVCLEGMLLCVLGLDVKVGESSDQCKSRLHPQLDGHPANKNSYAKLFPEPLLSGTTIQQIVKLIDIIKN
ncbi:hypothetical protein [Shewanella frigidimarina]|jgi:hypothetical protein|uniref:hypothetical protein n=1 Tax=Shewanella frigidimarina TaxID=56812 RepID=UPI003D7A8EC0